MKITNVIEKYDRRLDENNVPKVDRTFPIWREDDARLLLFHFSLYQEGKNQNILQDAAMGNDPLGFIDGSCYLGIKIEVIR